MRTCIATFLFPQPEPVICAEGEPGIIMTISGDQSSGTFFDLNTNTPDHPFTNPSTFDLEVGDSICVNEDGEVVSFVECEIDAQFFIDNLSTPVTDKFRSCNIPAELAQIFVNNALIDPRVTITITNFGNQIKVVVTVRDTVSHTIALLGAFLTSEPDTPIFVFEAPFVCNRVTRRRAVPVTPANICIEKFNRETGQKINAPKVLNIKGRLYGNPVEYPNHYCYSLLKEMKSQ